MEHAVVMTGVGGQGIQLMAKLLAQAGMREGREVMMFGLFMGTIRGGSSESTVVIADREIESPPIVSSVWGVLAMHPAGLATLAPKAAPGGVCVVNTTLVATPPAWPGVQMLPVPATELAKAMAQPMGAGMVALGAFVRATRLVGADALAAALADVLPPHRRQRIDANRTCLARGAAFVEECGAAGLPPAWG